MHSEACDSCGHLNPQGFKFCNECGTKRSLEQVTFSVVEIHTEADFTYLKEYLFNKSVDVPSGEEFRQAIATLPPELRQIFILWMCLDDPELKAPRSLAEIAELHPKDQAEISRLIIRSRRALDPILYRIIHNKLQIESGQ